MRNESCKMKGKRRPSRREFMEGALAAGASFAFAGWAKGAENGGAGGNGDSQKPLATAALSQPDNGICTWVGFSPVNEQTAFVEGPPGETRLYVSRAGQPDNFDVLWEPAFNVSAIRACAWSPNGREIAFLVQAGDEKKNSRNARISIYVAEVASRAAREPVIIAEVKEGAEKKKTDASYKKNLCWWNDTSVCVPAKKGGGILKFDSHTGQSGKLLTVQNGESISNLATARGGELRFIKYRKPQGTNDGQFLLSGLKQDGTVMEYGELSGQVGRIVSARLSQEGDFVFIEKREAATEAMPMPAAKNLIYKIETRSVIGEIPVIVDTKKDIYHYLPMTVRNGNELIMIEMTATAVDGSSMEMNHRGRAVKMML